MATPTMRDRFTDVTLDLLEQDERITVVLADIGAGPFRDRERAVNVGIREQLMIGVASGMALDGRRPIVHSYTPFLVERPFEQLKLDLAHQGVGAILVSIGASFDASTEGRTHQAPEDVALISTLPGWQIHVPGHADELETLLRDAAGHDRPVYIRTSSKSNVTPLPVIPGRLHLVEGGSRATVLAVGPMLDPVLEAVDGLDVTVLYATTVLPFDGPGLRRHLAGPNVVVVEPYLAGTSAHAVSDALIRIPHRLLSLGVPRREHRRYGSPKQHAADHGLDAAGLRKSLECFLGLRVREMTL